jgi:hypothetical protein
MTTPTEPAAIEKDDKRLRSALITVALHSAVIAIALFLLFRGTALTIRLFRQQDFAVLAVAAALLLLIAWRRPSLARLPRVSHKATIAALALAVLAVAGAGTWLVFGDYALSRDEQLAVFDSHILADFRLLGTLPQPWQPFAVALMPQFMLPIPPEAGWLSGYLPGNAALRAIGLRTIGAEWVNPLLAALSVLLVHRIGRRLWPDAPAAALIAAILLATSAQLVAMAMTPYSMTAHLALNLIWLWAFMRNRIGWDALALAAGFVATGLHQFVFHPMFAAPFIAELWFAGQRRRALLFAAAYAGIGLFWIFYWQIALPAAAIGGTEGSGQGISYLIARVGGLIAAMGIGGVVTMMFNLLRFLSWQNLMLVPLALLAWPAIRRAEGHARPLAGGIALTLVTLLILLPWQGHGWGYRYLHGLLGSFCLLAGYGWQSIRAAAARAAGALAIATAVSVLLIQPLHLKQAHDFVEPYRRAYQSIATADADVVLVDSRGTLYAEDLVRNAPDLSNRPIVAWTAALSAGQVRQLCTRYRVVLFDVRHARRAGIAEVADAQRLPDPASPLVRAGCVRPLPLS